MNLVLHIQSVTSYQNWLPSEIKSLNNILPILLFTISYFFIVLLVRWHILARFFRNRLRGEIEVIGATLKVESWNEDEPLESHDQTGSETTGEALTNRAQVCDNKRLYIINTARDLIRKAKSIIEEWHFWDAFFWSRGSEVAALSCVRRAERLQWMLCTGDELREHLKALIEEMKQLKRPGEPELAKTAEGELSKNTDAELSAKLQELLRVHHEGEAATLIDLIGRHNKAMWMITIALLLVTALAWTVSSLNPKLFLAGAIGGFLSRMMRILKEESHSKNAAAYGESWVTLFISPLVGALAGWTGVLLIVVSNMGMAISGPDGGQVAQNLPNVVGDSYYALGLAILLGFSERYFDFLVSKADQHPAQQKGSSTQVDPNTQGSQPC